MSYEKQGICLMKNKCFFTIYPGGDIPHIPSVELKHNVEELAIVEEMGKYN